ncbi:concanavalin A-like lectin/glucanase domain-containing protein [Daedaleopsis nitida]|nr:concanavalin A-like lectin/glucanase domain-containing protein [Daedaleopsis nitida]
MPEGCATWPAFWTLSQKGPWPRGGEVDVLEGANLDQSNLVSIHTTPSCMMSGSYHRRRSMNGNVTSLNCDTRVNFNQGCGVSMSKPASYGTDFNIAGGGYFAIVRTKHGDDGPKIRVWFWTRFDPALPPEIKTPPEPDAKTGKRSIYPTRKWGLPEADFPLQRQCDYDRHFDPHMFVFDLTFCGDWAGTVYPDSGCPGICTDYVDNNPETFKSAYWEVNSLRVYASGI